MGPMTLTKNSCSGKVGNVGINVTFQLSDHEMNFIPSYIDSWFPYLPDVKSQYGQLINGSCGGIPYSQVHMVYTTYPVPVLMGWWQWAMISAMDFEGTDLQIEMVATNFEGLWVGTSYIFFEGEEYKLDNPFVLETIIYDVGEPVDGKRTISATLRTFSIHFSITCEAPVEWFAELEQEGDTKIHTTLFGACSAKNEDSGKVFKGISALLEVKSANE